jgi:hypothetical protein
VLFHVTLEYFFHLLVFVHVEINIFSGILPRIIPYRTFKPLFNLYTTDISSDTACNADYNLNAVIE